MIKLGVSGAGGRMGRRIIELAREDKDFEVMLALEKRGHPLSGKDIHGLKISSGPDSMLLIDVFIDFTTPEATETNLDYVAKYKKALVLGTTGLSDVQQRKVQEISAVVPVVFSPNMSVGVNVLFAVLPEIAKRLGPDYSIEIVEAHHKMKKDSPSGTAKKLAQVLMEATNREIPTHAIR